MLTLYLDGRLTGFAKATKTCPAHKLYWRPLNWKRSLPVLKWTSESEYFLSFEKKKLQTLYPVQEQSLYPFRCACAARGNEQHYRSASSNPPPANYRRGAGSRCGTDWLRFILWGFTLQGESVGASLQTSQLTQSHRVTHDLGSFLTLSRQQPEISR